jgi:hypothetical protein
MVPSNSEAGGEARIPVYARAGRAGEGHLIEFEVDDSLVGNGTSVA